MKNFKYIITDEEGIHARPAGRLVKEAKELAVKAVMVANGKSAELTKLLAVMSLGVKKGTEVTIFVEGEDEGVAALRLEEFFKANL